MQRIKFLLLLGIYVAVADSQEQTTTQSDDNEERIVGGSPAAVGQFPHMVSVRVSGSHVCGGSVLSRNAVLTAAHCVENNNVFLNPSIITVYAGSVLRSSGGTSVNVASVIPHPSYNFQTTNGYDLAILTLASDLTFSSTIQAIPLASSDPLSSHFNTVTVTGWGLTSEGGSLSENLLYLRVRKIPRLVCRLTFPFLAYTSLCLRAARRTGICNGDSGSAAIFRNQIVGVASYGRVGCARNHPDVYARVSVLRSWISNNI